jgi:hypothetical protein
MQVQEAQTFVMGAPAGVQTQFQIEGGFNRILPQAEDLFRDRLDKLDALLQQLVDNQENQEVTKIGEISVNEGAFEQLVKRYQFWQRDLGNMMGVPPNPFDMRFGGLLGSGAGSINLAVNH